MHILPTVILAILIFGFLILIHELGHFIMARLFKVTVTEFSIGMGPKLIKHVSKKTGITYALSAIPFGGYVAMAGEGEESDDPNSFDKKKAYQRFLITVMGALVNIVAGFIAMLVFTLIVRIGGTEVARFAETESEISSSAFLEEGDVITHVEGKRVHISDELSYEIMRRGNEPIDLVVERNGEKIEIQDVRFPTVEQQGQTFGIIDFYMPQYVKKNPLNVFSLAFRKAALVMRMCWESIFDLITGRYSVEAVSGPIGISAAIGNAAKEDFLSLLNITVIISMNLGFMNLLPIPALDGGRIAVILVEMITKKKLPAKVEAMINGIGLILLLILSVVIMFKDIIGLF